MAECSYIGKFECAVCQGVEHSCDYCVLACGHPFHVLCVETWLERSATCPSCRAKVSRKKDAVRTLTGIETVADVPGGCGRDEAVQQRLSEKQRQLEVLHQQLADSNQQQENLQSTVSALTDRQERLQKKLNEAKERCATLEAAHLDDLQRLNTLSTEKQKLLDRYKTDMHRLQLELKDEQAKQRQATAELRQATSDLRRVQLSNPQLFNAAAIQHIAGLEENAQSAAALASALAQRNRELQEQQACAQQLQEQLRQQEEAAERELEVARVRHQTEKGRVDKDKQKHMKDALQLEYENSKLKQDNKALAQQLQELRGVLLALEGANHQQGHNKQNRQQQENLPPGLTEQQQQPRHLKLNQLQQQDSRGSRLGSQSSISQSKPASYAAANKPVSQGTGAAAAGPQAGGSGWGEAVPDVEWVPETQLTPPSPRSSSDQLLDELLGEDGGTAGAKQQQQHQQQQQAKHGQQQQQQQQQQQAQTGRAVGSSWKPGSGDDVALDVAAALGPGSSMLRPGPVVEQMPSFMARGKKSGAALGCMVTGDIIRSGPDGRGSTAKHMASGVKRDPQGTAGVAATSKKLRISGGAGAGGLFVKQKVKAAASGQTGIAAYFGRHH